jgi:alpha-1,6-mannosyltransferase
LKICDLTQFYSPVSGGVKRYLQEKVAHLHTHTETGEHLLIIPGERDEVVKNGRSTTYSIRSPLISKTSRYRALWRLGAVERILERERPDIIESGDPYQMAWKAIASGRGLGIPVVGFYHSHFPEAYLRSVAKFFGPLATELTMDAAQRYVCHLYNRFERTLVPSPALGALLQDWGVENVVNIDLGVNTAFFKPEPDDAAATRTELGIPPGTILLFYVGRLAHEKNTRTLFEAFRVLSREHPDRFHLLITGDGQQRGELEALRAELEGSQSKITWLPYCSDTEKLARLYRAADLFVHPGVQETFGLVALESQACGTPVIGIRGSYMDRIIHSDQTCWAAENSGTALAQAILDASRLDLQTIGAAAGRQVAGQYSWTHVFERLFAIYREVVTTYSPR